MKLRGSLPIARRTLAGQIMIGRIGVEVITSCPQDERLQSAVGFKALALDKAVGIDVDRKAHLCRPVYPADPVADCALQVEAARGVEE